MIAGNVRMADTGDTNARLRVQAEVSKAFGMVVTDYYGLLQTIVDSTAELVGDGCLVTLLDSDGETLVNAATAHRDQALADDYKVFLAGLGVSKLTSATISAEVVRTGTPKLVTEIDPETLVARTDEPLKPIVRRLNVHSFAVVPIRARQAIIGALSLLRSGPGRGYTADDLLMIEDTADRAGLAIANARLYGDLDRRVRERTAELEHANKELEAFSYSIAHDLRAPLRTIDAFSQILAEEAGGRLEETDRAHLDRVRNTARHMGRMIEALLDLARWNQVKPVVERVDLCAIAAFVLDRLREAEPGREVTVEIAPGLTANADPRLVEVVMTNLLGNAWKFTVRTEAARIEVGRSTASKPTAFYVRDNGAGFDPAHSAKLFGVFQRLHPAKEFEGTGIGLATVQRIVRRHGGFVWAEGAVGRGATVYFTLEPARR